MILADRGTSYFHSLVRQKNSAAYVPSLIKEDGNCTISQEEVILEFTNYFNNLLCSETPVMDISPTIIGKGPTISQEDCSLLAAPITNEEIKKFLYQIGDDKAPEPDGFTLAFFKKNWEFIRMDFYKQCMSSSEMANF